MDIEIKSARGRSPQNPHAIQTPTNTFYSPEHLCPERLSSIGWQFKLAMQTKCEFFLNIGSGSGILEHLLRLNSKRVITIDIDLGLKPSILAGFPDLPMQDHCIEVVMAFQVLEHLPISMFPSCIGEMARIARKYLIVSLPDQTHLSTDNSIQKRLLRRLPFYKEKHIPIPLDIEHFWEIGWNQISPQDIIQIAQQNKVTLIDHFRNKYMPYHHFFLFESS